MKKKPVTVSTLIQILEDCAPGAEVELLANGEVVPLEYVRTVAIDDNLYVRLIG